MCGFVGIYSFSGRHVENIESLVQAMNKKISHRGPDGSGIWNNEKHKICLGHQRLSIIDVSDKSKQPMTSIDGTSIVFNGEIYNYRELKLKLSDTKFYSDGDTEVVLELYKKMGKTFDE